MLYTENIYNRDNCEGVEQLLIRVIIYTWRFLQMKYDFTTIMDRHGMDAIAVDGLSEDGQGSPAKPKEGFDIIRCGWR